jgi:hypothetical protein
MMGTRISRSDDLRDRGRYHGIRAPTLAQASQSRARWSMRRTTRRRREITMLEEGGQNRKHETKSNKNGEYIQIGLQPGTYSVQADKRSCRRPFRSASAPAT